jgi:putative DNA primase/helicase
VAQLEDEQPIAAADSDGPPSNVTPISRARQKRKAPRPGERTELEISEMLVQRFGHELGYCAALGGWYVWRETHWSLDELEHARECAKSIGRELAAEAAALFDSDTFNAAKRASSARGVAAILDLARSAPEIVFGPDQANRDPWALNVLNGTLDLRTAQLRPHNKADLITRVCPVAYDPAATAPTFERFLSEVQPDAEVRAYLARLCGYAAGGAVLEHVLGVLWGPGANGKSVLADVVSHVLGGYARPGPSSLIVANGSHEPHPTDVASLFNSRLVVVHETKKGASFDASKVKLLTGGDRLTARHMRQDFFEFAPSHTLVMLSNYRPSADSTDAALWRRVQLVPFEVVIPLERRDPRLADSIRAEAPGVLNWIVQGALTWQRMGLAPPEVVRKQTEAYRESEDMIGCVPRRVHNRADSHKRA